MPEISSIKIRLIHDGKRPGPSVPEPVDFGIRDKMGAIHPGKAFKGRRCSSTSTSPSRMPTHRCSRAPSCTARPVAAFRI